MKLRMIFEVVCDEEAYVLCSGLISVCAVVGVTVLVALAVVGETSVSVESEYRNDIGAEYTGHG